VRAAPHPAFSINQEKEPVMPYITTADATELFYRSWGEGPAVVFTHGWALSAELWQPEMLKLAAAGFRCVAYDRRGHGRSDDPGRGYDFDTLADDLGAVLDALDLKAVTLVGHSMGNGEIARYLTRHGDSRVARIVMVAPALPYPLKTAANPDGWSDPATLDAWRALWATGFAEWLAPAAFAAYGPGASPDRVQHTIRVMLQPSLQAVMETNLATSETDFREELRQIGVPTLVLHGDEDQSCPLELAGAKTAGLIPDGRLKVYPGAKHILIGSHVDEIVGDILAFIDETRRSQAA
jgi:non-heme chloroperoxidase